MKASSLPNLNRETTSFPNFFTLFQPPADPDDNDNDTTPNKRPKTNDSEPSETSPFKGILSTSLSFNEMNENHYRIVEFFPEWDQMDQSLPKYPPSPNGSDSNVSVGSNQFSCDGGSPQPEIVLIAGGREASIPPYIDYEQEKIFEGSRSEFPHMDLQRRGKMEGQDDGVAEQSQQHELQSILSCSDRDFLIRNNDDQVSQQHELQSILSCSDRDFLIRNNDDQIEEILDLLGSSKVKKIGILGTVGIGKTAMLKYLRYHEKVAKTFEMVIWLNVSIEGSRKNLTREHLLQTIVRRLKLNIGGSSNADEVTSSNAHEVAERISMELQGKKFLLLLDDVKECLDLLKIGIPESNNGSKIVLTTRLRRVCQPAMVEQIVKMTYLSHEKAWKMFQDVLKGSGVLEDPKEDPKIKKIAWRVCKECYGLPLLIQIVASTFRFQHITWSEGLNGWRKWPAKYRVGIEEVYNLLKFCYDDLDDEQHQKFG